MDPKTLVVPFLGYQMQTIFGKPGSAHEKSCCFETLEQVLCASNERSDQERGYKVKFKKTFIQGELLECCSTPLRH